MSPAPPPLDAAAPTDAARTAVALGCFWGPDARFGAVEGVIRTRVGYAGGTTAAPTYDDIGDHIETVWIEYDPAQVDYAGLLLLFWASHDPTCAPFKRQYQPALFPQTDRQAEQARASRTARKQETGALTTEIIAEASFHRAESYHQNYKLRRHPVLFDAVRQNYPTDEAFISAPAATLVNGYVGGHRAPRHLDGDLPRLSLPREAAQRLRTVAARRHDASLPE
ncbi:MAG: methionine sulfoxide reductase [Bacteroidetes bacterium SW_9_63_38]|nr:MAG: methionine sulfoxide reductase [Bacteroidetes bacterium SW_9_63_38]